MHVLAVEPFYGGSHRAFLDGLVRHSRHDWTLVTGKPVHWKWRSRSAPLELAASACRLVQQHGDPDVVLAGDMLDLPSWRGMLRGSTLCGKPTVVYFHENQWTYPVSPEARVDHHFGYTNLLSAIAADACWFNSAFHRREFLSAGESFVRRMPDARSAHDFQRLAEISEVFPPGFDPPDSVGPKAFLGPSTSDARSQTEAWSPSDDPAQDRPPQPPLRIGWVSRWEYDKRPDRFLQIIERLEQLSCDYQLVLLGPRPSKPCEALETIRDRYGHRRAHDGFAGSSEEYWMWLQSMDAVVSTADHEFFGIAICEAIWAGAAPVLPRRLSYPEIVSDDSLYDDLQQAANMLTQLCDRAHRRNRLAQNQALIEKLTMKQTVQRIDDELDVVAGQSRQRS